MYGFVIVIKRTGQDGSKYPITEKEVKIGTQPECRIIINTPFVAGQHCQLTVQEDGQMKVENFSTANPTLVNQTVVEDAVLLAHGDVIEIGGRLVRFEYHKDSPHYRELSPPQDVVNIDDVELDEPSTSDCSNAFDVPSASAEQPETSHAPRLPAAHPEQVVSNAADLPTGSAQLAISNLASLPSLAAQFSPKTSNSTKKVIRLQPQTIRNICSRKNLQNARLMSHLNNRRKSDAIRALNEDDLRKIVAVNGRPSILRTPVKSSPVPKTVGSPYLNQMNWITQSPSLDTIGDNQPNIKQESIEVDSSTTPKPGSSSAEDVVLEPAEESSRMSFLLTTSDDKIPSTPSTSKSTTPEKCLLFEQPNTPEEPALISEMCAETPPEVKTPVGSPRAEEPSSTTPQPIICNLANDAIETPPEVVTPQSLSPFKKPKLSALSTPARKTAVKTPMKVVAETPSPKKTPKVTPSPKRTPKLALTPKRTPKVSPSPKKTPKMAKGTPMFTPSPKRTPRMSPATPAFKTPMTTPAKSAKKKSPLLKTPPSAKRSKSQGSTRKQRPSPRTVEKTPSPKRITKKASSGSGKKKSNLRVSAMNVKVARAFGIKTKILSTPDKNKSKALLVLGKAVNSKSRTQMKLHKKILQKAIKTKNQKKTQMEKPSGSEAGSPSKRSPVKPKTPKKTPKFSPLSRTPGVRSSKRISSQIESVRPDFTELSPSALGLAPRFNASISKSPFKQKNKRASAVPSSRIASQSPGSSRNLEVVGFSTPRKNVADTSINLMEFYTPVAKGIASPRSLRDSIKRKASTTPEDNSEMSPIASTSKSPAKSPLRSKKSPANSYLDVAGVRELFSRKSPRNDLMNIPSIRRLVKTPPQRRIKKPTVPRTVKSPRNDLTDIPSIRRLMKTPKPKRLKKPTVPRPVKSPKNDLTDIPSIRRLMKTPPQKRVKKQTVARPAKSPKNDLTDVPSIRRLMKTPPQKRVKKQTVSRPVKSPKNDLTNIPSIRRLMKTPPQKRVKKPTVSRRPKNDVTIRNLGPVESPEMDLTDTWNILFNDPHASPEIHTPLPAQRLRGALGTPKVDGTPLRRGRSSTAAPKPRALRTRNNTVTEHDDSEIVEEAPPARGRRKPVAKPSPKRGKKTTKVTVKTESPLKRKSVHDDSSPSPPKRGRTTSRAAVKAVSPKEDATKKKSPSPPKRGRKVAKTAPPQEDTSSPSPPKRGRKVAAKAEVPDVQVENKSPKTPLKRGRKAATATAKTPTRSRRAAPQVEEISVVEVEKKPAKGRARATRAKASPSPKSPSPSPKQRTTRARTQTATRSTRGRAGAAK